MKYHTNHLNISILVIMIYDIPTLGKGILILTKGTHHQICFALNKLLFDQLAALPILNCQAGYNEDYHEDAHEDEGGEGVHVVGGGVLVGGCGDDDGGGIADNGAVCGHVGGDGGDSTE